MSRYLDVIRNKDISDVKDPGADIDPAGVSLWVQVLTRAREVDNELYSKLMYIRGTGARLVPDDRTGYKVMPIIDPTGKKGWSNVEEYASEKWCLQSHIQELSKILMEV